MCRSLSALLYEADPGESLTAGPVRGRATKNALLSTKVMSQTLIQILHTFTPQVDLRSTSKWLPDVLLRAVNH